MRNLCLALLLFCGSAYAQPSNFHIAGTIAGGPGFDFPIVGVTAGGDVGKSVVFSVDGSVLRARKTLYKDGIQFDGRQTLRFGHKGFFQVGVTESHNRFAGFTKTTIAPLVGVGFKTDNQLFGVNYRHDVTSENSQRIVEGFYQGFAKHHFYGRVFFGASNFVDGNHRAVQAFMRTEIGVWF